MFNFTISCTSFGVNIYPTITPNGSVYGHPLPTIPVQSQCAACLNILRAVRLHYHHPLPLTPDLPRSLALFINMLQYTQLTPATPHLPITYTPHNIPIIHSVCHISAHKLSISPSLKLLPFRLFSFPYR